MDLYDLYNPLQKAFVKWINSIEKEQEPHIPSYRPKPLYPIEVDDSHFVVFNYTHTLQKLYDVDEDLIYYPHGEAGDPEHLPQFGHGDDKISEKMLSYTLHDDENEEYIRQWMHDYLEKTRKDVGQFIRQTEMFLKEISDEDVVIKVIGCSFSKVDIPYFIQAVEFFPNARWQVSYYSEKDKERACNFFDEAFVDMDNVCFVCTNEDMEQQ